MTLQITSTPIEQPEPQQARELSWSDLMDKFLDDLIAAGKGDQVRNFRMTFKFYLEAIGLTKDSPVGAEMREEYEDKIKVYIGFEINRKLKESSYKPRVSKIKKLKKFLHKNFAQSLRLQTLPQTFGLRLHQLIISLGFSIMSFWRTLPDRLVSYENLHDWCKEKHMPSKRSLAAIKTIEKQLNVPIGTLIRSNKYLSAEHYLNVGRSDYGNKIRALQCKPYHVLTPALEEEFLKLQVHKTEPILPDGEEREDNAQWTVSEDEEVPSAAIIKRVLSSFMGYCVLPKDGPDPYLTGAGLKLEDLSMALLADQELVEGHLKFMRLRSGLRERPVDESTKATLPAHAISANGKWEFYSIGGKYNDGTLSVLNCISSLLRPSTGYLYQNTGLAEKLGSRMTAATWHEQCVRTRTRVTKILKKLLLMKKKNDQKNFDFGRDPKERIGWMLELHRPLLVLNEMLKEMLDDLLPASAHKLQRARQYRDILLFALLCANPLRIRMFSIMEFEKNLVRMGDGSWRLRFKRGAFKNRRGLKSDYEVVVAQQLWPMLDRYREEFHPVLAGSTGTRYVFLGGGSWAITKHWGAPLSGRRLSNIIERLTEIYVPCGMGFNPHSFRHLIATDIIKKDPRIGFFLAAIALHDKLETVENNYIHLKTSEFFEPINTHFSEAWSMIFDSSREDVGQQKYAA